MTTATTSEIAAALGISDRAVRKRARSWNPTGERVQGGGETYEVDTLQLRPGEVKKIKTYLTRKSCKVIPITPDVQLQAEAEKERQRLEARQQSLELFPRLPQWQRRAAEAKLEIMLASDRFIAANKLGRTAGQDLFAHEYSLRRADVAPWVYSEIDTFDPATLRNWIREESEQGMMGLVDLYGNRKGQSKIDTYITGVDEKGEPMRPMVAMIKAVIFEKPHLARQEKKVNEILRAKVSGAPLVSDKTVQRWITRWIEAHRLEWDYIVNPDTAKNKHLTAAGNMDEGVRYIPNARWEIDATPADLLLTDGRNKIIGLIDVGTRRLILQVTATEKSLDNARVARRGILAWGVPAAGVFITDQGNPYKAAAFTRFLDGLDIRHEFCPPFSGDKKPFIERAFHTFSHDLLELLPGYIGHNVTERKAIEARKSFAQRLMKKGEVIEAKLTAAELQAFCDRWCASYHDRNHSTLCKSPNQVVSEWPHAIHRINDERALDILLSPVAGDNGWRTITKKGVRIDKRYYVCGEFGRYPSGTPVQVLETDDVGRVIVNVKNDFDVMEFLGIAECPELTGISRAEVAAVARARQKRVIAEINELKKEAKKELKGEDISTAVLAYREREAAERMANVSHFPRPTKEYTTSGLQAAAQAAAVLDAPAAAPVQVSPEAKAAREKLQAEAVQQKPVFEVPQGDREKYRLWCQLDGLIVGGVEVSEPEMRFYEAFRKTPAWRAFKGISEDIYSLRRN
jgi:hypothetical protein